MRQPEYTLDPPRRRVVLQTILEVAQHRRWTLYAVHVRTTHVHIVVAATGQPEKMLIDFKAWASRRLREAFAEDTDRDRWTQHGSTRYVWDDRSLAEVVEYVLERQGEKMECYDGLATQSEPQSEPEA